MHDNQINANLLLIEEEVFHEIVKGYYKWCDMFDIEICESFTISKTELQKRNYKTNGKK